MWLVTNRHGFRPHRLTFATSLSYFLGPLCCPTYQTETPITPTGIEIQAPRSRSASETLADGTCLVSVWGEVDLSTAPHLERVLDEASRASDSEVLVEFSRDSFIDSTGLHVLIQAAQRLKGPVARFESRPRTRTRRVSSRPWASPRSWAFRIE